jgi:LppM domain
MKKNYKLVVSLFSFLLIAAFLISGCVNYDQNTTLNMDGSGSMKIHYWSKMSNFSMGTSLGKFDFDEKKAKDNYSSSNTDVKSVRMEDKLDDSTKHVYVELTFKDINKLPDAKGFSGVKPSWKEEKDGMELKYVLLKDSSAAKNMGSSDYTVTYTFEMPGEIVSTNATKKDGKTLTWDYKVSDLGKDIELTAVVKKEGGKTCGIFGAAIAFGIVGLAYYTGRNKKRTAR